jgi:hypothetical protein
MKHILNNISQEEKNRILEQHSGGKTIDTSKFKRLLESTMGDVKPLIAEEDTSKWIKTIAFEDPETTKSLINIQINPHMIGLVGNDVKFEYVIAGKSQTGTGIFDCNSKNSMHFDGKPLTGTLYISPQRVNVLKSKCGRNQGYASTNTGEDKNVA